MRLPMTPSFCGGHDRAKILCALELAKWLWSEWDVAFPVDEYSVSPLVCFAIRQDVVGFVVFRWNASLQDLQAPNPEPLN